MSNVAHENLISRVIDTGFHLHNEIGPGLLESVYETLIASRLQRLNIKVVRQMPVNIQIDGISFADAYRVDLYLDDWLSN